VLDGVSISGRAYGVKNLWSSGVFRVRSRVGTLIFWVVKSCLKQAEIGRASGAFKARCGSAGTTK
jgi:hypothetical protein